MVDWSENHMTPFDCRVTTESLQMAKLILPYLPTESQRILAIYVKYMELKYALSFPAFEQAGGSALKIMEQLQPFIPPSAWESMEQVSSMMSMMEMYNTMFSEDETVDNS